jgi:DNA-binding phage protein
MDQSKSMMNERFSRFDTVDYLKTENDVAAYLEAAISEAGDDPKLIGRAVRAAARALRLHVTSEASGLTQG